MKRIVYFALLLGSLPGGLIAAESPHLHVSTNVVRVDAAFIHALAAQARTNNPALRAADSRVDAAIHNADGVRTWEDPTASVGGAIGPSRGFKASEEGDLIYGLEQKLPLFKKPEYARKVAASEIARSQREVDLQGQQLQRDIAKAVYRAALWDRLIDIGRQDLAWLATMTTSVEQRYAVNQASQVEVLRLQSEQAKRREQLKSEENLSEHERVTLNRLLNRELHATWPLLELPAVAESVAFNPALVALALESEPRLKVLLAEVDSASAVSERTKRERLPEIGVGIEGRQYSGDGGFREGMFTLRFTVPWGNAEKYRSDRRRDEARVNAAEYDVASQKLALQELIHHQTVELDAARREALLYRDDQAPRAEQALNVALLNWENNRGMLLDVLEARRMLLEARLMHARAVAEQHQMLAELMFSCGVTNLSALPRTAVAQTFQPAK